MKKVISIVLMLSMVLTTVAGVVPAFAADVVSGTSDVLFKETFEDYDTGNWLENMAEGTDLVDSTKITNMGASDWTVYGGLYDDELYTSKQFAEKGVSVGVVADPDNAGNKVLKIDVGNMTTQEWIRVRRNSNDGSAIKRADLPKGKKMVIKAKFKLPTNFTGSANTVMFTYDQQSKQLKKWMNANMTSNYNGKNWTILATDAGSYLSNLQSSASATVKTGEWFDLKYIVDITDHKTAEHPADTYRAFYDGSIYTHYLPDPSKATGAQRKLNDKFPQPSETSGVLGGKIVESFGGYITPPEGTTYTDFGNFFGTSMTVAGSGKDGDYLYMDDIEVYYIDPFKQEGTATFEKTTEEGIWYAGKITIPFNNNLMEVVKENGKQLDYISLFTVKDAEGNVVENAISNAYADGKNLVIEPSKSLERNKAYTIYASPLFMDAEGQGLNQFSKDESILTFDTAVDPFAYIYFDENFESYKDLESNWLVNKDSNGYVTLSDVPENAWRVGGTGTYTNGVVKITADPLNSGRGNVLEINSGTIETKKSVTVLKTPNGTNPVSKDSLKGKRIVIEGDIYLPAAMKVQEETVFSYYGQKDINVSRGSSNKFIIPYNSNSSNGALYVIGGGSYDTPNGTRWNYNAGGTWHTYRYVIDVSEDVSSTRVDTARGYIDGKLVTKKAGEGTTAVTEIDEYPLYEADGTGRIVVDHWKRTGEIFGSADKSWKSAGDFYGIYMAARQGDATNQSYYVDNMKAYYVEDLTMITPDLSNYTGGAITLKFNQPIADSFDTVGDAKATYGLNDMFKLTDAEGNEIANGLNARLSADKKNVILTPKAIESNKDYKIVISRYFRDAEGQGLTKNNTEKVLDLNVGEFVAFAFKGLSQNTVSGFVTGRDVKVTAEFSMNIDDEMVANGIVVKNADTNEGVPYGAWTHTYGTDENNATDYKKVVLDFSNLPTANYIVTTDADFAIGEEILENAFTLEINQAGQPIILFEEDFDTGYTIGENWLNDANAENAENAGYTKGVSNYRTADGKWDIQSAGIETSADDFVGVVPVSEFAEVGGKFEGNMLKIDETGADRYSKPIGVRRNFDTGAISLTEGEYAGKRLIFEADIYFVPKSLTIKGSSIAVHAMKVSRKAKEIYEYDNSGWKNVFAGVSGSYRMQEGAYAEATYGPIYMWQTPITTPAIKGQTLRLVVDQSSEKDTMRMYVNGSLISKEVPSVLDGHARNGMILADAGSSDYQGQTSNVGDTLYGIWNAGADSIMYIDNFKAYIVDNFEVESVTGASEVFNTAKAKVEFTFTKPVDPETVDGNVVLLDKDGKAVSDGIKSATLSDAGYKLTVALSENLPGDSKYTIKLKDGIADTDGLNISKKYYYYDTYNIDDYYTKNENGNYDIDVGGTIVECIYTPRTASAPAALKRASDGKYETPIDCWLPDCSIDGMKTEIEITTSKYVSLFASATEAAVTDTAVTTNVTFTNPETEDMEVLCFIAAYGKYNEMLGCTVINKTVEAGQLTDPENVTITLKKPGVEFVKMFVWNNYSEMKTYHPAEMLYTK